MGHPVRFLLLLAIAVPLAAQTGGARAKPQPMPADRADDAYAIYSQLLKSGPLEWRSVPRTQWLVESTTTARPIAVPCSPPSADDEMDPRHAVEPPADRQAEWSEVLADFDRHCHDVIQLDPRRFRTQVPVHLLDPEAQKRFAASVSKPASEFAGAAGLHQFTEVFFNKDHSLAFVQLGMWCGMLCGDWTCAVLERRDGQWHMLPWVRVYSIS